MKTLSRKEHRRLTHVVWGSLYLACVVLSCTRGGAAFLLTLTVGPVPTFLVSLVIAAFVPKTPLTQVQRDANRALAAAQRQRPSSRPHVQATKDWSMEDIGGAAIPVMQMASYDETLGRHDPFERTHNVDGTPMSGSVDANGNSFGSTGNAYDYSSTSYDYNSH